MKNKFLYIVALATALFVNSCVAEYIGPDKGALPQAGSLTPEITVDQATNYVTFSIKEKGVVPIWIFGEELIDGKAGKKYSYTDNGLVLRFREAGEHSVELKAYNANGISQGSQILTFTLENTYRDPFDATPYKKAIANTWIWDKETPGHFGCGPGVANPTEWWSCNSNEKDGKGLYDDILTFTLEGEYTFNPGEGGTVYVNWGSGYKTTGHEEEIASEQDYQVEIEEFTHPYTIENNWNEAGIEEIFLVLQEGDNLSYIPNAEALTSNARYQFIETATASIKKNLQLVNAIEGIAWKYSFIPFTKSLTVEELLAGTDPAGKVWVMDSETVGHLACGPITNPAEWWSAGPNEKTDCGMYDNELTFTPDGTYKFNPGADGSIYVNWGCTTVGPNTGLEPDNIVEWTEQTGKYIFDGETITLPENFTLGYIPSDEAYAEPVFAVAEITETKLVLHYLNEGCSWQLIFRARDYVAPENPVVDVDFDINGEGNLWRTATITTEYWYSPADWSGGIEADAEIGANNSFIATIPEGVGGNEWQAQNKLFSGIATDSSKKYDFCCTFLASEDMTVTVKLTGNPEGDGDPHSFFYDGNVQLVEGEAYTFIKSNISQRESNNDLTIIFDFGRSPSGSTISVTDICFQEHKEASALVE